MASFVLSFFPLDVLDEIWDLIESVVEGFLTYSSIKSQVVHLSTGWVKREYLALDAPRTPQLPPSSYLHMT